MVSLLKYDNTQIYCYVVLLLNGSYKYKTFDKFNYT